MDKQAFIDNPMKLEIINKLGELKQRLDNDVEVAFHQNGEKGEYRLQAWIKVFSRFAEANLPNELDKIGSFISASGYKSFAHWEDDYDVYRQESGDRIDAYLESLTREIVDGEYDFTPIHKEVKQVETASAPKEKSNKVFIVHGHDGHVKERTARFVEKLGFEAIILHEQASKSRTIIEKIEDFSDVTDFAIVLYTPDDVGVVKTKADDLQPRARQNVIFEHGFLMGKLGRENVVPLVEGDIELPNDISGIVYVSEGWEMKIAQEMHEAGYDVDFNKLFKK